MKTDPEGKITTYVNTVIDYTLMNVLFCVLSIPIITIGPSLTALYTVTMHDAAGEYGYHVRVFWKEWKRNFKKSILSYLALVLPAAAVFFAMVFYYHMDGIGTGILCALLGIVLLYIVGTLEFLFPYLSRYDDGVKTAIAHAHQISIHYFGWTLLLVGVDVLLALGAYNFSAVRIFFLLIGYAFTALCKSYLFRRLFLQSEKNGQ